ncbi:hypothetical protein K458DRAFT_405965 [Lentithecium fluviatile CBS 122367]|uniref:Uncharacterized protein n=1 Tax=Lentithecium fluviatile CBS 122367 TaxID=1168545 RepID=A0A6G1IW62_9PLEO|nr:hypothetical protein K458DRAFT_405965 [Lentithecium fluviatile CBS 122367]
MPPRRLPRCTRTKLQHTTTSQQYSSHPYFTASYLTTMDTYYQPKSGFNWADDHEDDTFDLYTFRASASAITTAPTLEELGPLQKPCDPEDLTPLTADPSEKPTDDTAPSHRPSTNTSSTRKLPGNPALYLSPSKADWPYNQPLASTYAYNASNFCGPPAYSDLSWSREKRESYADSWRGVKARFCGMQLARGQTFMMRPTRLSEEWAMGEEDKEEVPELASSKSEEEEVLGGAQTPPDFLLVEESVKENAPAFNSEEQVVIKDGEESDGSEATSVEFGGKFTIDIEEKCPDAGYITTSSQVTQTPPESHKLPSLQKDTLIRSVSCLVALGTGFVAGVAFGAVLFRPR